MAVRSPIKIGPIVISQGNPPTIIAEIGINHGGSLKTAKEMVASAYRAGAKLIKHQTHIVEDEMSHIAKQVTPGNASSSIYEIMQSCAMNEQDEYDLKTYVESLGMVFISTPFSRAAADRLHSFGVHAYKIGSGECNNYPLIEHIAAFGKPMIVSTGMNDIHAVRKTVEILKDYAVPFALMHTTNLYPTPAKLVRLGGMQELMQEFPETLVGLSDHTTNNNACIAATALGASILERHYTDNMERVGPDIVCSMDEQQLRELLYSTCEVHSMLGGKKEPADEEKVTIKFAFATVVSIKPIKKGELFTRDNIWVKRPGIGEISAAEYKNILGKRALVDVDNDEHISYSMIENF